MALSAAWLVGVLVALPWQGAALAAREGPPASHEVSGSASPAGALGAAGGNVVRSSTAPPPAPGAAAEFLPPPRLSYTWPRKTAPGDVDDWLSRVDLIVEESVFPPVTVSGVVLKIGTITCTGLRVLKLGATGKPVPGSFTFEASGVRVTCRGSVSYEYSIFSGTANITLSTADARMGTGVRLETKSSELPLLPDAVARDQANPCHCTLDLHLKIEDQGSTAWTKLIKLIPSLVNQLQTSIRDALDEEVCGDLLSDGLREASAHLEKLATSARSVARTPPPVPPAVNQSGSVDWSEFPVTVFLKKQFAELARRDTLTGLLGFFYPDGQVCLDGQGAFPPWMEDDASVLQDVYRLPHVGNHSGVRKCLKQGSVCVLGNTSNVSSGCLADGTVKEQPPAIMGLVVSEANTTALAPNLTLGFHGPSNVTVSLGVEVRAMELAAAARISFAGWAGHAETPGLERAVLLRLRATQVSFAVDAAVAVNEASLLAIPSVQWLWPQCYKKSVIAELSDILVDLQLENVSLSLDPPLAKESGLVTGAFEVAQRMLDSALAKYGDAVQPLVQGAVRMQLPEAASEFQSQLKTVLSKVCPTRKGHGGRSPLINEELAATLIHAALLGLCLLAMAAVAALVHAACVRVAAWRRGMMDAGVGVAASTPAGATPLADHTAPGPGVPSSPLQGPVSWGGCPFEYGVRGALCCSPVVPWPLRAGLPLTLGLLALFIMGSNFMQFARTVVVVKGEPGKNGQVEEIPIYEVMPFSLLFSSHELWWERDYVLAIFLVLFSGVLPYAKLLLLLFSWVLPEMILPSWLRGKVLVFVDAFGKYSLVDVFVIQFIGATLSADVDLTNPTIGGRYPAEGPVPPLVSLRTEQTVGFAAFVFGTAASLVLGHVALYYQKETVIWKLSREPAAEVAPVTPTGEMTPGQLGLPRRRVARCANLCSVKWSYSGTCHIGPLLVLSAVLATSGLCMCGFRVVLDTELGVISDSSFSVIGVAWAIPRFSPQPNGVATRFGQVVFILFAVVVVYLHLSLMMLFWCGLIPKRFVGKASTLARTFLAWASLDVTVVSMIVTLLEMSTSDLVSLSPKQTNFVVQVLGLKHNSLHWGLLKIDVTLEAGAYVLLCAAAVHYWVSFRVLREMDCAAAASRGSVGSELLSVVRSSSSIL